MLYNSPFRSTLQRMRPPTAADFDVEEFRKHLRVLDDGDGKLALTAAWLFAESKRWRDYQAENPLPTLSPKSAFLIAAAMLNREFHVVSNRLLNRMRRAQRAGGVSWEHLTHVPIGKSDENFNVDANSAMDAATDVVNHWLREAVTTAAKDGGALTPGELGSKYIFRTSVRRGQNDLWTRAIWEHWAIDQSDKNLHLMSPENKGLATIMDAWVARHEANSMEFARLDAHN